MGREEEMETNTDPVFQKRTEDKTGGRWGRGTTIEANSGAGHKDLYQQVRIQPSEHRNSA